MTFPRMRPGRQRNVGVTLIELVITIVIGGIVSAMVVYFIQPVRSYIDSSRRAALADTADTALHRIGRDLRLALPNSVRVTTVGAVTYIEFLLIRTGGRYRAEAGGTATCGADPADVLIFTGSDSCFTSLGNVPNAGEVATSDFLVVFNLGPGSANADAYESAGVTGGNKSKITALTGDKVEFEAHAFTYESPGKRFFIIEGPVTYACDKTARTLTRYWGYTIQPAQPTPPTAGSPSSALMASGVDDCTATYQSNVVAQSDGLVTLFLKLKAQDSSGDMETVSLYQTVHVNNVP